MIVDILLNREGTEVAISEQEEKPFAYARLSNIGLYYQGRVKMDKEAPSKPIEPRVEDKKPYAERGNKDKTTNRALFCNGQREIDGFKRDLALNYLYKRMVRFAGWGKGKGEKDVGKRVSSSAHHDYLARRASVEDVAQEAFILFWKYRRANRDIALDASKLTVQCCRFAMCDWSKRERKLGNIKGKAYVRMAKEEARNICRRNAPRLPEDETTVKVLDVVRERGRVDKAQIAYVLGVHRNEIPRFLKEMGKNI